MRVAFVLMTHALMLTAIAAAAAQTTATAPGDTAAPGVDPRTYFKITVVDLQTGRGVPLVELRTVSAIRHYTDSAGVVAFYEPGLMNHDVFFFVTSHGYEFPADHFGMRGKALRTTPGGAAKIEIRRINIAERLYRVTGGGIYRDSVLLGERAPISHPVLDGLVLGQDSVFSIVHRGKVYWFWGDTSRPAYPLGNFHMSGATSQLPAQGGLDPEVGVDLAYFVDEHGFSRPMAPMAGSGPTWADAFVVLRDADGRDCMYGAYAKIRPEDMAAHERGLMVLDDDRQQFEKLATFPLDTPIYPGGHALRHKDGDVEYVYFATPYPLTRVRATPAAYRDLSTYEAFTCLKPGSTVDDPQIDRADDGTVRYGWKRNAPAVQALAQDKLIKAGTLKPDEALLHLQEADTGKPVLAHAGSVYWNAYRHRWVMITCEQFGTSMLGETWFAEADTPLGPWVYARKIVTHDQYTFYNPKQHPMFDKDNGRIVFFEGTYANTFSGNPDRTPRYDYNQIMYKLDLADERLALPVAVYEWAGADGAHRYGTIVDVPKQAGDRSVAFFALDRPTGRAIAVYRKADDSRDAALVAAADGAKTNASAKPAFYALPADVEDLPATTLPLYEFVADDGHARAYSTDAERSMPGYQRSAAPICRVWRNPMHVRLPMP